MAGALQWQDAEHDGQRESTESVMVAADRLGIKDRLRDHVMRPGINLAFQAGQFLIDIRRVWAERAGDGE